MDTLKIGGFVVAYTLYCGLCDAQFDGLHVGVIGDVDEDGYYVRELTCPECKAVDLYGNDGGALYTHDELVPAADDFEAGGDA